MGMPETPVWVQNSFRFRDNVPDPASANTAFDAGDAAAGTDLTLLVDTLMRCRFLIQQTNTLLDSGQAVEFELRFELNALGGFVEVGTQAAAAIAVRGIDGQPTNHDNTTQVMGAGTFFTGDYTETATGLVTDTVTAPDTSATETEVEFCFEIAGAEVSDADTIDLRVYVDNNQALDTYTDTPRITVDKPAVGGIPPGLGPSLAEHGRSQSFPMTNYLRLPGSGLWAPRPGRAAA